MVCLVMTGMVSYKELNVPEAMAYVMEVVGQGKVAGAILCRRCNWPYGCYFFQYVCGNTSILCNES